MKFEGIHHISAITGDARRNVDFYTRVLGLRLTAKSVNQDDPGVYHLFYGDEEATPGADLTFFEYPGAIPGRPGAGMVHRIVHRVGSREALAFWAAAPGGRGRARSTSSTARCASRTPSGSTTSWSWTPPATRRWSRSTRRSRPSSRSAASRACARTPSTRTGSAALLRGPDGRRRATDDRFELRGDKRGGWIAFDPAPAERGRQSAGTVHHIAWGTYDADLMEWIERIDAARIPNSGYVDRHYFHSLYFREPGGVLYELATEEPGFLVDGLELAELGTKIILPPFLEDRREQIEARLTPLPDPRAAWSAASS